MPSMTARPGRVSSVSVAANLASPRALRTTTASPSAMPRGRASSGWRKTEGPRWRRRSMSDWLKDEFRKKRLGGTMH